MGIQWRNCFFPIRFLLTKFSDNYSKQVISTKHYNLWQAQELNPVCGGGATLGWSPRGKHLLYSHGEYVSWNGVGFCVEGLGSNRLDESAAWWTGLGWQKGWGSWAWRWRWNHTSDEIPQLMPTKKPHSKRANFIWVYLPVNGFKWKQSKAKQTNKQTKKTQLFN